MTVKKFLSALILLFESCCLLAQPSQTQKFLPVLAPASPEASAFARYGNYQVNLFTGIPDISIPLYEIKIGELNVPVSLNYHSSGIKVSDMPSRIGLGWDLQAGGSITRKIMGHPDELPGNYLSATPTSENRVKLQSEINPLTQAGLDYLRYVDQGLYDVEPDIFSYSFPGHGGKFLFNQKNNFAAVLIPYAPINITQTNSPSQLSLGITDESGIVYKFDTKETTSTGGGISINCLSGWLLSDMISANKQDSIHFRYISSGLGMTDSYYSDFLVLDDNMTGSYTGTPQGNFYTSQGSVATNGQQLTEIDFKNGKVVFEAAPETRQDFASVYSLQNRLNSIKIYSYDVVNQNYNLLKSIDFFHGYYVNGTDNATKRLRLDSLQINMGTGSVAQTYKFSYNTSVSLPSNLSRKKDFWGYFNNITNLDPFGNPTTIAKMQVSYNIPNNPPTMIWIGGDHTNARDPDPNFMQAYILQKITFPTAGNTQFEYETNQYLDDQSNPKYAGGLRIRSIKNYRDNTATPLVKTYKYGLNESGYGRNNFLLEDHFFMSVQNVTKRTEMTDGQHCDGPEWSNQKTTRTYFANPTVDIEGYDGAPVVYPFVTEYTGDGTTNAGKTTYTFADKADAKTTMIGYGKPMLASYHFVRGQLTNRSDYRRNADNSYSFVTESRKKYQYFPFQNTTGGSGLGVFKSKIFEGYGGLFFCTGTNCDCGTDSYSYQFNNYEIVSGDNKLISDTTITYDQNDPSKIVSNKTTYTYDDLTHLQVTQSQTTNSKGQTLTSAYTYPYNYATVPHTNMTANHIYDKIIKETKTNGSPLSVLTNNYSGFSGNNFLLANIQLQVQSNTVETRAFFNQYDIRGNILEMQKAGDVKQSFIWDYQMLQPVASVTNAAQADIAYSSFEADGKGNWTFTGIPGLDPTAPTGDRMYNLSPTKVLTKTGLTSANIYIVSYWTKNASAFTISGTQTGYPIAGRSINGWHYFEHKITGQTTVTLSGTGAIDEVRLYPAVNALMITYTYKPLTGITSQCDANNRITYYEYDGLGRLMMVRDQDNNIIKQIYYNYAGQPENFNIFYNALQSSPFIKTGCTGCLVGSSVNYTVPAQMYSASTQAAADQLATDDVVANGQSYANANGSCVAPANAALTGTNAMRQSYSVQFHNNNANCIPSDYSFSLSPGNSNVGSVPAGNYTVTFTPPNSNSYTCRVNALTLHKLNGAIGTITTDIYPSGASVGVTL
jgi:YD repeat-containing protein